MDYDRGESLLDHEYDGIQEFDNPTPGWWHILFLGSVVFSAVYIAFWHFSPMAWSVYDAHEAAQRREFQAMFAEIGELEADERTIVTLSKDPKWMSVAEGMFVANCASCHNSDGGGNIGPNLTDEHYKNITDVVGLATVLRDGAAGGAMPAWDRRLHPNEIVLLAAYAAQLRGQNVPGRPPEGELIGPWPEFDAEPAGNGADGANMEQEGG